jgi:glycosyltransferase involved in cell wall biosynthesis
MNNPLVSVIIPFYNPGRFLREAVLSALSQSYSEVEIILVDDGSTEPYSEQLLGLLDRFKLITQSNKGACSARNAGLSVANGEFIKFLDADDILFPGAIESEVKASLDCADQEFTVGRSYRMDARTGIIRPHAYRDAEVVRDFGFYETVADVPVISAPLYPKSALARIGGFDENLMVRQDFDVYVRILISGFSPRYINSSSFVYRDHDSGIRISRQSSPLRARNEVYLFEKLSELVGRAEISQKVDIAKALAACAWVTARNNLRDGHDSESEQLFTIAKRLDGNAGVGRMGYRILCRILGPKRSEFFLRRLKSVKV